MSLVIIDNYDSFTYNLFQMVQSELWDFHRADTAISRVNPEASVQVFRNDAITFDDLVALKPSRVILSPGPGHPANPDDFGIGQSVIAAWERLNCPVLGVCLGHQGLVHYLGGKVVQAPTIVHGKTSQIEILRPSPLLDGLPNPFQAMRYHSLVARQENFPEVLEIIARETADQLIMGVRHRSLPLYGLQFHPESIGTPEGAKMLRNFIEKC